ncbi:hypothetical protein U9M48_011419 [Paspalum notatum var. saurae]|uniref:Secreted protein n=1 Tax=Paspalum notatum var. saurae TaxID=547442 RepID=A0AAQ3WH45_PASNO
MIYFTMFVLCGWSKLSASEHFWENGCIFLSVSMFFTRGASNDTKSMMWCLELGSVKPHGKFQHSQTLLVPCFNRNMSLRQNAHNELPVSGRWDFYHLYYVLHVMCQYSFLLRFGDSA